MAGVVADRIWATAWRAFAFDALEAVSCSVRPRQPTAAKRRCMDMIARDRRIATCRWNRRSLEHLPGSLDARETGAFFATCCRAVAATRPCIFSPPALRLQSMRASIRFVPSAVRPQCNVPRAWRDSALHRRSPLPCLPCSPCPPCPQGKASHAVFCRSREKAAPFFQKAHSRPTARTAPDRGTLGNQARARPFGGVAASTVAGGVKWCGGSPLVAAPVGR